MAKVGYAHRFSQFVLRRNMVDLGERMSNTQKSHLAFALLPAATTKEIKMLKPLPAGKHSVSRNKPYQSFISDEIRTKYRFLSSDSVTDVYTYLIDNKIVAFLILKAEELKCGFLHYHISHKMRDYFAEEYPQIDQPTNQIYYLYTEESLRRRGIASLLLEYVFDDLKNQGYKSIWLKDESRSCIYYSKGFVNFIEGIRETGIDVTAFLCDYEQKVRENSYLINGHGDTRLVKILN
jgi:ribosomal protein S18 acetylase RimI-like enzyme